MNGFFDDIVDGVSEFAKDPIGKTFDMATQPIRDAAEVIDGLTEGELRTKAALRLGADVASGMALGELIDWYKAQ